MIRHTSVDVPQGVCYGRTDVPLKDSFEQEARQTLHTLRPLIPFDAVWCSPLSRCTRLAAYCGFPDATRDDRLLELDFGQWEMVPYDENHDPKLQEWYDDYLHVAPTGGESFTQQMERVQSFLDMLRTTTHRRVALFTHGGVILCAQVLLGELRTDEAFGRLTPYGGVVRLQLD